MESLKIGNRVKILMMGCIPDLSGTLVSFCATNSASGAAVVYLDAKFHGWLQTDTGDRLAYITHTVANLDCLESE